MPKKKDRQPANPRIGREERDEALAELREHYEHERLDLAEFQDRMARVLASKTAGELEALLVDLPPIQAPVPVPHAEVRRRKKDQWWMQLTIGMIWGFVIIYLIGVMLGVFK